MPVPGFLIAIWIAVGLVLMWLFGVYGLIIGAAIAYFGYIGWVRKDQQMQEEEEEDNYVEQLEKENEELRKKLYKD
jgi:uncharacterized membrane-anchored protein YhcB (DUF1043 family)